MVYWYSEAVAVTCGQNIYGYMDIHIFVSYRCFIYKASVYECIVWRIIEE